MPEGDTIYRAARALNKALAGRIVTTFETALAKLASVDDNTPLLGRTVERVEARGKWCLIYFSGDLILVTHMLMSGSWHIYRTGERWHQPRRAMRVVIRVGKMVVPQGLKPLASVGLTDGGTEVPPLQSEAPTLQSEAPTLQSEAPTLQSEAPTLQSSVSPPQNAVALRVAESFEAVAFNVPVAEFHTARSLERSSQVPKLGPDILSGEFTVQSGMAAMQAYAATNPEAEVGVTLLNQRVLAGLGNVYKSEVAFAAGVNPFRQLVTVTAREIETMVEVSQRYMRANVVDGAGDGIVTYSGNRRTTQSMDKTDRLWVYGRQGQECRRCGAIVEMRKQGTQVRSTYWCPGCQPWVAAAGQSEAAPVGRAVKVLGRRKVGC